MSQRDNQGSSIHTTPGLQSFITPLLLTDKHRSHAHTAPNTHTSNKHLLALPFRLAEGGTHLPDPRASQGVTHGDCSANRVDDIRVEVEVLDRHDCLRREGFVDFEKVDIGLGESGFGQDFRDGECGADTAGCLSGADDEKRDRREKQPTP